MRKDRRESKKRKMKNIIRAIAIIILLLIVVLVVQKIIKKANNKDTISLVINNTNVTNRLTNDLWINEKNVLYMSKADIQKYLDNHIYMDEQNHQIITTYGEKIAVLPLEGSSITINGTKVDLLSGVANKEGEYYLPISQMSTVYNMEYAYIKETKVFTMDSLDRALVKADVSKNTSVKSKTTIFSTRTDKVKKGEKVVVVKKDKKWTKIRTGRGKVGYIKTANIQNEVYVRKDLTQEKETQKINLVWDYYSEVGRAPDRTGTTIEGINVVSPSFFSLTKEGKVIENVGNQGQKYIDWAKKNNYKVWAIFSNNSDKETTSKVVNSFQYRQNLINKIVTLANKYQLQGINIDFENMKKDDKDMFSRFIIELKPMLKEAGVTLSVDVTAPDGGESWSECYDRNVIGQVADYTIFMAYDQYGSSSKKVGTTAGYNWVENNLKKFIDREEVPAEKLVLGIPLYTRLWSEKNGEVTSKTVYMRRVNEILPKNVTKTWDDELKQNYVEYQANGKTYKMWIEDIDSIKAKVSLVKKYNLAGTAAWEKDRETEGVWSVIHQALNN